MHDAIWETNREQRNHLFQVGTRVPSLVDQASMRFCDILRGAPIQVLFCSFGVLLHRPSQSVYWLDILKCSNIKSNTGNRTTIPYVHIHIEPSSLRSAVLAAGGNKFVLYKA